MSDTLYALIELEDQYLSIISVSTICQPRKEISEYEEGEDIHVKFKGSIYRAVIADISHTYGRVPYTSSQNGRPNIVFICNKIDSNKKTGINNFDGHFPNSFMAQTILQNGIRDLA